MANRHRDQRGREADLLGSDILTSLGSPGGPPGGDPGIREENPLPPTCTQARTLGGPRGGSGPAEPGTSTPGHPDSRTLPLLGVCAQESNRGRRGAWREPSGRGWQQKPGLWLTYQGLGADAVWSPVSCLRGSLRWAAACVPLGPCPKGFGLTKGRHVSAPGNLGRLGVLRGEQALGHLAQSQLGTKRSPGSAGSTLAEAGPSVGVSELVRSKPRREVATVASRPGGVCPRARHRAAGHPPEPCRGQVCALGWAWAGWRSLTDLAVRMGDVATAVKRWIMAILQRSAAEPVRHKGRWLRNSVRSGAPQPCPPRTVRIFYTA